MLNASKVFGWERSHENFTIHHKIILGKNCCLCVVAKQVKRVSRVNKIEQTMAKKIVE